MMKHRFDFLLKTAWSLLGVLLIALSSGCATEPGSEAGQTLSSVQKVQPGQQYANFLTDYSKLSVHDGFAGEVLAYVSGDVVDGVDVPTIVVNLPSRELGRQ